MRNPLRQALAGIAAAVAPESSAPVYGLAFEDEDGWIVFVGGPPREAMSEATFRERFGQRGTISRVAGVQWGETWFAGVVR